MRTVQFVENDDYCQRVLAKNFPGVPIHGDIKTYKGERGSADIITGGFPCQPFSTAGKRRGSEDDRALWPEMLRVIEEVRPAWALGENVAGIIGLELDRVLSDLEDAGYEAQVFVIPACAVDAPHRRYRPWIMAHAERQPIRPGLCTEGTRGQRRRRSGDGGREDIGADTECERLAIRKGEEGKRPQPAAARGCRWATEPDVGRVVARVPARVDRLKGLGNSIVPQVAYQIMRAMMEAGGCPR